MNKLNLGCGTNIKKSYINVDYFEHKGVDKIYDLNKYPLPFQDNQFKEILLLDILEHLGNPDKYIRELWRISKIILSEMGLGEENIELVKARSGHDPRYAIDHSKITREMGWKPKINFEEGLKEVIKWYKENGDWWKPLKHKASFNGKPIVFDCMSTGPKKNENENSRIYKT
jgi:hypothetical protein